jgi:hypothetical protein
MSRSGQLDVSQRSIGSQSGGLRSSSAPRNRNSKEAVQKEIEEEFNQQFTFQPKINAFSNQVVRQTLEERIEAMAKHREAEIQRREREKLMQEKKEMEQCTFKPRINKWSQPSLRDHIPADERLFHDADNRVVNREKAKRELEDQVIQQHSFKPQLNPLTDKLLEQGQNYRPVHERVGELQRKKYERMQKLRLESEKDPDLQFNPKINELSSKLARQRSEQDVAERLHTDIVQKMQRRSADQEEWQRRLAQDCTFSPHINPTSQKIVEESEMFAGPKRDFLHRQSEWNKRQRRRQELDRQVVEAATAVTFKPKINETSEAIVSSKKKGEETEEERLQRLAYQDLQRKEAMRKAMEKQLQSQYSFKPEINPVSKAIGKASSIDQLVSNEKSKKVKERMAQEAEQAFKREHTFRPKVNPSMVVAISPGSAASPNSFASTPGGPLNMSSMSSSAAAPAASSKLKFKEAENLGKTIEEMRKEKERKIEEARKALEFEELKECTFQPVKPQSKVKQPEGPILVRGLGKYLERKEHARKIAEEQKEREEKAFLVNATGNRHPFTVPQPFQLHGDYHSEMRKQKIEDELRRKEMSECTFHPRTNESENRQILQRILSQTEDDDDGGDGDGDLYSAPRRAPSSSRSPGVLG